MSLKVLATTVAAALCTAHANEVGFVGKSDLPVEPAFLKVNPDTRQLLVSTFFNNNWLFPRIPDDFQIYPIDNQEFPGSLNVEAGESATRGRTAWPNEVMIADDVIGDGSKMFHTYSLPGGFIVPFSKGALHVVIDTLRTGDMSRYIYFQVSPESKEWFYHRALWVDMDGDGHKDLLTARADYSVPPLGSYTSQVLWFKNPGNLEDISEQMRVNGERYDIGDWIRPWELHMIDDGSVQSQAGDTNLLVRDLDGDGKFEIITTHFWQNSNSDPGPNISVYHLKNPATSSWATASFPEDVGRLVVADDIGPPFDIEFHDINGDGVDELLATNHEYDGDLAIVVALEVPQGKAYLTEPWTQHVLAQGFPNRINDGMSPGQAQAFYPSKSYENQRGPGGTHPKPWIIVAGDGTGSAHLLIPTNTFGTSDWGYDHHVLYDSELDEDNKAYTIGAIALDKGSQCTSMYIPVYEMKRIVMYSGCELEANQGALVAQSESMAAARAISNTASGSLNTTFVVIGGAGVLVGLVGVGAAVYQRQQKKAILEAQASNGASFQEEDSALSSTNPSFNKV